MGAPAHPRELTTAARQPSPPWATGRVTIARTLRTYDSCEPPVSPLWGGGTLALGGQSRSKKSESQGGGRWGALRYDEERGVVEFLVRSDGRSDVDGDGASVRDADELAGVLDGIIAEAKDGARDGGEVSAVVYKSGQPSAPSVGRCACLRRGKLASRARVSGSTSCLARSS